MKDFAPVYVDDGRAVDVLLLVLMRDSSETLMPELFEIFGKDALVKFLDIFGGRTIQVPDRAYLVRAARDVDIYLEWRKDGKAGVDRAARRHDISRERAGKIAKDVRGIADGVRLGDGG